MKTSRPISTVSYNTPEFFKGVCDRLVRGKVISFYAFIVHKGEDDECGKKDHIHAYFEPAKAVQTEDIKDMFLEYDPNHPKPLACLSFRNSKFPDWYQYALHDPYYLMRIGEQRLYSYKHEDIFSSDEDELHALSYNVIGKPTHNLYNVMDRCIALGMPFNEIIARGLIPPTMINCAMLYFNNFMSYRHDQIPEEPKYEVVTGQETYARADYFLEFCEEHDNEK